jgi:tetratricopeptide (TPR) repeat protein
MMPDPRSQGRTPSSGSAAPGHEVRFPDRPRLPAFILFGLVLLAFLPSLRQGFITYDDPVYVTQNPHVTGGLTRANIAWAFTSSEASNWHPLTWLSHMADCSLFGLEPWGHHLTSVLLHALNAALLFAALRRMTGAAWRSMLVAALFGLHPLHVESVAWISERKDVLSTFFEFLALIAYAIRSQRIRDGKSGAGSLYILSLLFFSFALMAKQMPITLPCVLLLLDFWPLGRWPGASSAAKWKLILEKIPYFIVGAAAAALAVHAQQRGGAVASSAEFPMATRVADALIAYCDYLGKCFVPRHLAIFYPSFAEQPPLWKPVLAACFLVAVTAAAAVQAARRPYLIVGWLWFLGTLVPVIGIVQVGGQFMADRYSYVPLVGIFIMAAWAAGDVARALPTGPRFAGFSCLAAVAALTALTVRQLGFWRDGATLFRHAIVVTDRNWVAHANLYATLAKTSSPEAGEELNQTLRILAGFAQVHVDKGAALERQPGREPDAIKEFRAAVEVMPDLAGPHFSLGAALAKTPGSLPEAVGEFREATRLDPDFAEAHYDLGIALSGSPTTIAEAADEFSAAARLEPANLRAWFNLAYVLSRIPGRASESISAYEEVVRRAPDNVQAQFNLGLELAAVQGRAGEAIAHLEAARRIRPDLRQAGELIQRLRAANPQLAVP